MAEDRFELRQSDQNCCPDSHLRGDAQGSSQARNDPPTDRESHPGTFVGLAPIEAPKGSEDLLEVCFRDADPVIANPDLPGDVTPEWSTPTAVFVLGDGVNIDARRNSGGAEANRVLDQVVEERIELGPAAQDRWQRPDGDIARTAGELVGRVVQNTGDHHGEVDRMDRLGTGRNLGVLEEVVDQELRPGSRGRHSVEVVGSLRVECLGAVGSEAVAERRDR